MPNASDQIHFTLQWHLTFQLVIAVLLCLRSTLTDPWRKVSKLHSQFSDALANEEYRLVLRKQKWKLSAKMNSHVKEWNLLQFVVTFRFHPKSSLGFEVFRRGGAKKCSPLPSQLASIPCQVTYGPRSNHTMDYFALICRPVFHSSGPFVKQKWFS